MSFAARQGPAVVWIELTSKCPLRCGFCSRENLRGEGEHMQMTWSNRFCVRSIALK